MRERRQRIHAQRARRRGDHLDLKQARLAGLAAAVSNGIGIAGVANQAAIAPFRLINGSALGDSKIGAALAYRNDVITVKNNSWGAKSFADFADYGPLVFEGNAPADVRENLPLGAALQRVPASIPNQAAVWLGAPNSIKGPTTAVFRRQSGSHLLVVSQSEERTATLLSVALVSLAAQFPRNAAHFVVLDSTPSGFPQRECLERLLQAVPHTVVSAGNSNLMETMAGLAEELKQRADNETAGPEVFVLVHGLQNFKKLRAEDEFGFSSSDSAGSPTPAATLLNLITEGSARGFHLVATCDTCNNVSRFLGRKTLSEFEMRVVFQMSASDSASLIDAPAAASLGLHRALYYNDREGSLETFRPYAQPDGEWLESVMQQLQARI